MNENKEGKLADEVMHNALMAFEKYSLIDKKSKAGFLKEIAKQIELNRIELIPLAIEESHLSEARLQGELTRTINQLNLFATLLLEGSWVDASIDIGNAQQKPYPKPDVRKMLQPMGPIIVFGASNFPFAFSTAGGDTASALAAGASVVIKAHPAHYRTSSAIFKAIKTAIAFSNMPEFTVQHVEGSFALGKALVQHSFTSGVGFTGSFSGGKALMNYAAEREKPIPVFAEMSSINPTVLYPDYLKTNYLQVAEKLASSITLGAGQFCTNPGLLLALDGDELDGFIEELRNKMQSIPAQKMLHEGIYKNYIEAIGQVKRNNDVEIIFEGNDLSSEMDVLPFIAKVKAAVFLDKNHLKDEIFGPYSLLVVCKNKEELKSVLKLIAGQLTTTLMATEKDMNQHSDILHIQQSIAGRIIVNDVPTGVEVCSSMVHGGPYPATSDARYTSVGTAAIKRWVRPVCYQGFPQQHLPDELKNDNPLKIWRLENNEWKK
ncbi:aldehyde dehydrogenase (NADP(+)) [Arachidicoccus soli]|uniref:Aldehyde dehydrogenase (NADP(+)) n=1 Tax=Arachidicoccus soli TaxID=2341117 RepID=A0A386HQH5_9BACT|nr:aldehyde dehydrogenase (NADP(+)) [Arachidicoccus soli]AYD47740.1 aldehyde dehydrogenase (NADP(+)) [Arachidicoccus soli]